MQARPSPRYRPPHFTRRTALQAGSIGLLGMSLADVTAARSLAGATTPPERSVLLVFLTGGLSHQDTLDMKPAAPAADFTTPVTVLNAANVSGLAASQSKKLEAGGFTKVTPTNGSGTGVKATTVFYATDAQKVTADAVAQLLGITTVTKSPTQAKSGITVVLMPGFTG